MALPNYTYNRSEEAVASTLLTHTIPTDTRFASSLSQPGIVDLWVTKDNDIYEWLRSRMPDNYALQRIIQEGQEDDTLSFINDQAARDYLAKHPDIQRPLMEVWSAALEEFHTDAEISMEVFSEPDEDDEYLTLYVRQFDLSFSQPGTVDLSITKGIWMNDACEWGKSIIPDNYALQRIIQEGQEDDTLPSINDPAVLAYLTKYPDVRRPLMEVWRAALEEFRTGAVISIEVFSEPDEDDEYLSLYVRQEEYQDDILDRIDAIRAQMRGSLAADTGRVLLTTDFQPPH